MAEKPSDQEEVKRRARDDAFGRLLGDEWEAVEPGIYRMVERSALDVSDESLDQSLMGALPKETDDQVEEAEPQDAPPTRWRRR